LNAVIDVMIFRIKTKQRAMFFWLTKISPLSAPMKKRKAEKPDLWWIY
jgi:hypothetical protein